ncbi:MAG: ACP S-malonyltransferase [Clostridiales bacterium]|nr:ACP S-malonyltransferase [Clostridiales bacterium]
MKIAFIFPGQGAQYIGMGKELYDNFNIVKNIFDKTDEILIENFVNLVFNGNDEDIKKTENTQPAILMVSTAISQLLMSEGIMPTMTAGLSLGEYSALVAANSISYEDALPLVRKRGQLMNEAVPSGKGAMAAVLGLAEDKLLLCCEEASEHGTVSIANYNCPGQLVLSGDRSAVEKASELAKKAGAKRVVPLPVSGPFHSPLLKPAGDALAELLKNIGIKTPQVPVVSNVSAKPSGCVEEIRELLAKQVSNSVRWEDCIRYMIAQGVDTFLELGPGKALSGFLRKIDNTVNTYNVEDLASLENVLGLLKGV